MKQTEIENGTVALLLIPLNIHFFASPFHFWSLQSCIMQVEFTKPEGGGLGFALVGGTNGSMLRVREICSGGVAEQDGRLRVGDILLEVLLTQHCTL